MCRGSLCISHMFIWSICCWDWDGWDWSHGSWVMGHGLACKELTENVGYLSVLCPGLRRGLPENETSDRQAVLISCP